MGREHLHHTFAKIPVGGAFVFTGRNELRTVYVKTASNKYRRAEGRDRTEYTQRATGAGVAFVSGPPSRRGRASGRSVRNPDAVNGEGMKWSEWFNASQPSRVPREDLHEAWKRGEDPTEYRGAGGRRYHTAFFHKISNPGGKPTPDKDVVLSDSDLKDEKTLAAALRVGHILAPGERLSAMRREGNRIVAFSHGRAVWHSLIITPA